MVKCWLFYLKIPWTSTHEALDSVVKLGNLKIGDVLIRILIRSKPLLALLVHLRLSFFKMLAIGVIKMLKCLINLHAIEMPNINEWFWSYPTSNKFEFHLSFNLIIMWIYSIKINVYKINGSKDLIQYFIKSRYWQSMMNSDPNRF